MPERFGVLVLTMIFADVQCRYFQRKYGAWMPSAAALAMVHAGSKKDLRLRVGTYGNSELHARRAFRSQGLCPAIPGVTEHFTSYFATGKE